MQLRFSRPSSRWTILSLFAAGLLAATATAGEVQFSKKCLMISPNEGCAVADVNKDGKLDIIAGTHWFAAPDFIPHPIREIPEFGGDFVANNGDHAWDVDGDGWVDQISGGWMEPEIFWFKNPGEPGLTKGLKWEKILLKKAFPHTEYYAFRDIDGDGTPEIIADSWVKENPLIAWQLVKDDEGKPALKRNDIGPKSGHGIGFGDINGDGREDIIVESGWYERPEGDVFAQAWKHHPETALPHPSCPCLIVDVNQDGRNDIVWGKAHDYGVYWWEQGEPKADGTTTWKEHKIDDTWSQAHCLVWEDLDGDGQCELITGKRVRGHAGNDPGGKDPECLYYYTWDQAKKEFTRHDISPAGGGVGTGMQLRVVDLNGDGKPDIAVGGKTGTWVLINEGSK